MAALMQLPAYEVRNALVDFSPITQAIDSNRQNVLAQRRMDMDQERLGMERKRLSMTEAQHGEARQEATRKRIGGMALAALQEQDPQRLSAAHQSILSMHPNVATLPAHYRDNPRSGLMAILGDAGMADEYLKLQIQRQTAEASAAANRAHAGYYTAAARNMTAKADAAAQPTPSQSQPLQDAYGMTEDGQIIPPSQQAPQPSFSLPQGGNVPRLPPPASADGVVVQGQPQQRPPGMMRLGGPTDDIDASMRLDEGRRSFGPPQGVQLAQDFTSRLPRGKQTPSIPNFADRPVQEDPRPTPDGSPPSLMQQEMLRLYGGFGQTPPDIRGMVTLPQSGKTDVPATREAAGQRAYMGATPEQQERYRKFRQEQQLWTSAYGKPARAGYYYGPRGEELAMSEKTYKGDKDNNALMDMNLKIIAEAQKKLTDTLWPVQAVAGYLPNTDTKLAISDLKGAATQIAFILSGKSVSNAERAEFMERYAPTPTDSNYAINHKVGRMKMFYQTLIEAKRAGMDEQKAWNFATAKTLSTPLPDNPARGLSDDELLKELNK